MKLWVPALRPDDVEVLLDGQREDSTPTDLAGGIQFSAKIPEDAGELAIRVRSGRDVSLWRLALASRETPMPTAFRDLLEATGKEGNKRLSGYIARRDFTGAREALDQLGPPPKAPAELVYTVAFFRAQLARREGDFRAALQEIGRASRVSQRTSSDRDFWIAEQERALLFLDMGRAKEAALLLAQLSSLPEDMKPCEDADLANNRGWASLLAAEAGESYLDDPVVLLAEALAAYDRCRIERKILRPFDRARFNVRLNLALAHLQAGRLSTARDFLIQAKRLEAAGEVHERLWLLDLEARIALAEGHAREALGLFEHLEQVALGAASVDGRLRAALGRARASEALHDRQAAMATLREAEGLLSRESLRIPVQAGRATFLGRRQAIAGLLVDLLLAEDRQDEAFAAARRGRSRVLRQLALNERLASLPPGRRREWSAALGELMVARDELDEVARTEWRLPADRLRNAQQAWRRKVEDLEARLDGLLSLLDDGEPLPVETGALPGAGELVLAYHPGEREWVAFAAEAGRVDAHRFALPDVGVAQPDELAARLLAPFRSQIRRAGRVRVLSYGPLREVDFHGLPFAGDVLLAGRPVVYGLDLPTPAHGVPTTVHRALVVADPSGDLPGTREEARVVRGALQAASWTVTELTAEEARRESIRDALASADLLHYAGHGSFGGFGGWDSSLRLAGESRLTLSDLLTLDRAPSWVVLSGCETGRIASEAPVEGLSLAHAFLLAGSRAVIASTRPVKDRETLPFIRELYRRWQLEGDPAAAFQQAQLSWRREAPSGDWASFRIFGP